MTPRLPHSLLLLLVTVMALPACGRADRSDSPGRFGGDMGSDASADSATSPSQATFSYEPYSLVLERYVNEMGMVDYRDLRAHREPLNAFAGQLAGLQRSIYEPWSTHQKIAFWINAYNALTLQVILDHYPIDPSFLGSLRFPDNSIRQIPGVWDKITFPVMGRSLTLDQIEHEILRKEFQEPRIHMALVCAARGCPPIRSEPYTGRDLDGQLDDQARQFLANPEKFRIDRAAKEVRLSSIFKWFGEDFVPVYGTDDRFKSHDEEERAVLNFIQRYLEDKDKQFLLNEDYDIKYLDYDWTLNEQTK